MEDKIDALKYTVENTDIAYMDACHSDREKLYCLGADKTRPRLYMTAIVEYSDSKSGTIITAWPQKVISPEGVLTYVKSKR
jgi:hypothetical protein